MTHRSATLSLILMFLAIVTAKASALSTDSKLIGTVEKVAPTLRTFGEEFYRELHDAP